MTLPDGQSDQRATGLPRLLNAGGIKPPAERADALRAKKMSNKVCLLWMFCQRLFNTFDFSPAGRLPFLPGGFIPPALFGRVTVMPDWKRLTDRLWLWLAAFAVFPLLYAVGLLLSLLPAAVQAAMLKFFECLPLLCLLWLPVVVHLLLKNGTTLSMPIVYYCYLVLLFRVAGPSLPSHGVLDFAKSSLVTNGSAAGAVGTLFLTIYWAWQIKYGNGTKKTRRRIKHLPQNNEKQLDTGEKHA